jgi:PhnB protein
MRRTQEIAHMSVKPIPDGYHTVTPYLICKDAARALDFYAKALGAEELMRHPGPGGKVMHAEIKVGDSILMMADEFPEMGFKSPESLGGSSVSLMVYVKDVDTAFDRAVRAGGTVKRPLANQFYGDRSGTFADPFGHVWTLSTHVEDVSPEELQRRMESKTAEGC